MFVRSSPFLFLIRYFMNQTKYSKVVKTLEIKDVTDPRTYQINKLSSQEVAKESFKIIKIFLPSVGVGLDALKNSDEFDFMQVDRTATTVIQLLADNLEDQHFAELQFKMLDTLRFNGQEIEDWSEHFDDKYAKDYLEVLVWSFKENFYDFFMESTILSPTIKKLKEVVLPNLKTKMQNVFKDKEVDCNEE